MRRGRRIKKIDYNQKRYTNPFFQQRKKSELTPLKIIILWVVVFLMVISLLLATTYYFGITKGKLMISGFTIEVPKTIAKADIERYAWQQADQMRYVFLTQHFLPLFNTKELSNKLNQQYLLGSVEILKKWPNKIDIKLTGKPYHLIWQEGGMDYVVNRYDLASAPANQSDASNLTVVENKGSNKITNNVITLPSDKINFICELSAIIKKLEPQYPIQKFEIDDQTLHTITAQSNALKLYFNDQLDPGLQIEKLLTAIKQGVLVNKKPSSYIDLRWGDKIYLQ